MMMFDGFPHHGGIRNRSYDFCAHVRMHAKLEKLIVGERPWLVENLFRDKNFSYVVDACRIHEVSRLV